MAAYKKSNYYVVILGQNLEEEKVFGCFTTAMQI